MAGDDHRNRSPKVINAREATPHAQEAPVSDAELSPICFGPQPVGRAAASKAATTTRPVSCLGSTTGMTFTIAAGHNSSLGYLPPASFAAALIKPGTLSDSASGR